MSSTAQRYMYGVLMGLFLSFQGVQAATIYVSAGSGNDSNDGSSWDLAKETINGGLTAAESGDLILVTNGTYTFTHFALNWIKSGETLRSVNGAAHTIINPYESGSPATRVEGTIDGFTIQNGNAGSAYGGGGILLTGGTAVNCVVTNCTSGKGGGGIYIQSGGVVSNCVITECTSSAKGAGVYIQDGTMVESTVTGSVGGDQGGGVFLSSAGVMKNCIIRGNRTTGTGGGVYMFSSASIYGCLITGNQTTDDAGGVYSSAATVESCTIVGNSASGGTQAGGLYATSGGSYIRNCIMYYNDNLDGTLSASVGMYNSCYGVAPTAPSYTDNITDAPEFVTDGSGYGTNHVFGDYMLRPTSPCVDTGLNRPWMTGTLELAGTNRIIDGTVNRGAYEATGTGLDPQTITFAEIPTQNVTNTLTLAATASSGLAVSYAVDSGPAQLSGTQLSFTGVGLVSITASQAGNETYDPAPDVTRTFGVFGSDPFKLQAVALTNSVVLRWPDPYMAGYSNRTVLVRYGTDTYPATSVDGSATYTGTNQVYTHTGRTPGTTYYYSIFPSDDGSTFVVPE